MLLQIGAHIQKSQLADAVNVLVSGDGNKNPAPCYTIGTDPIGGTSGTLSYDALVDFWAQMYPFEMNTMLVNTGTLTNLMKLSEFKNPLTGLNFQGTGRFETPLGAKLLRCDALDERAILAIDRRYALEMVQAGELSVEYDKLIDRQLERAAITAICGFSKIYNDAACMLEV